MDLAAFRSILVVNVKHFFPVHMGLAVVLALLTPVLFNITGLDAQRAAQPLEMFLSLTGMVLLVPVFSPEQEEGTRDVIRSKKVDYLAVCQIRVLYSIFFLALLVAGFVLVMNACESQVSIRHFQAGFASALFLGAVGFAFAGISGNVTVGYMAAFIYYLCNMALKKKLGIFYLFSMCGGDNSGKLLLVLAALVLMEAVFLWKRVRSF